MSVSKKSLSSRLSLLSQRQIVDIAFKKVIRGVRVVYGNSFQYYDCKKIKKADHEMTSILSSHEIGEMLRSSKSADPTFVEDEPKIKDGKVYRALIPISAQISKFGYIIHMFSHKIETVSTTWTKLFEKSIDEVLKTPPTPATNPRVLAEVVFTLTVPKTCRAAMIIYPDYSPLFEVSNTIVYFEGGIGDPNPDYTGDEDIEDDSWDEKPETTPAVETDKEIMETATRVACVRFPLSRAESLRKISKELEGKIIKIECYGKYRCVKVQPYDSTKPEPAGPAPFIGPPRPPTL